MLQTLTVVIGNASSEYIQRKKARFIDTGSIYGQEETLERVLLFVVVPEFCLPSLVFENSRHKYRLVVGCSDRVLHIWYATIWSKSR